MKLVWSAQSLRDLDELLGYVAQQNTATAGKMATAIDLTLASLVSQPKFGTRLNRPNSYRFPIKRYGITVFYVFVHESAQSKSFVSFAARASSD